MKLTEIHSLTMQVKEIEKFKNEYEEVVINLSLDNKMPMTIKPIQVILDMVTGHCTMYILRDPKLPSYKMNDFVFKLAQELKMKYDLSTVVLKRKNMYVDENNIPETIKVDKKEAAEIIKKAQEDELFSDKYKEYYVKKQRTAEERDEADHQKACAYMEKLAASIPTLNKQADLKSMTEKEAETDIMIEKITFSIEKNGQLCLVF